MSLNFREGDLIIGDKDIDHEVEITIQTGNKTQSVWINSGIAEEIIEHLKLQFEL